MRLRTLAAGALAALVVFPLGPTREAVSAAPPATVVVEWDEIGAQAFTAASLSPAEGHTIFAYASAAVYDAVQAVRRTHEPFAIVERAAVDTSPEAAVAAAAHRIFAHYLPNQAPTILNPAYANSLAAMPDGPAKANGVALGERVAAALIAVRADDGFRVPVTYTPPNPPIAGVWLPTAPTPPIGSYLGRMRPFVLPSAEMFRPGGPPALDSPRWARDYNEVKAIGSSTSTTRTPEQTLAARFWAEAPVQQARSSFRRFITDHGLDIFDASRFLAVVSVTYADAFIGCFEAKYHYAFWRPITAIRAGTTDGRADTLADPAWSPLLPATPNHPEYPSAHSCITPAAGVVASRFLGTDEIDFTVPSLTGLGDRTFATTKELERDVSNGRIYGGIHFRSAVVDGARLAKRTAHYVLAHHFRALDDDALDDDAQDDDAQDDD